LKSTETAVALRRTASRRDFSNFGSLKSTETREVGNRREDKYPFQQFRLVEEH